VVPHDARDDAAHRRVTQDAHKWLNVETHPSGAQAARALAADGFVVYAGHLDPQTRPCTQIAADRAVALLFGNEHEGPSAETLAACAGTFRIPMAGFTQSFNVSVAAGIALSQICAGRRAFLGSAGDLPKEEQRALRSRFLRLAAKLARRVKR
jgi:tRNA (guanosine-2'-O-)-methyltransferase